MSSDSSNHSIPNETIPAPYPELFCDGISHPELHLWDAWSYSCNQGLHLYCLAVSNKDRYGHIYPPHLRNQKSFHIRHFFSEDSGGSWRDLGCFQQARVGQNLFDSRSIWSGSILALADGRQLTAYTGIREQGSALTFQQSLGLSISTNWMTTIPGSQQVLSDPLNEWQTITQNGYFLGEYNSLGHKDGESGGSILAWRDPFLLLHGGVIHMYWCAKTGYRTPALGHAVLQESESGFSISKMYPPVAMPDGNEFTQLELPKVIFDEVHECFLLIVSSCNRMHEQQSDKDADKRMRLYKSKSLNGPWHKFGHKGSTLKLAEPHMFGITIIKSDLRSEKLNYVAPYTEDAGEEKFLTLSKTYFLDIGEIRENSRS